MFRLFAPVLCLLALFLPCVVNASQVSLENPAIALKGVNPPRLPPGISLEDPSSGRWFRHGAVPSEKWLSAGVPEEQVCALREVLALSQLPALCHSGESGWWRRISGLLGPDLNDRLGWPVDASSPVAPQELIAYALSGSMSSPGTPPSSPLAAHPGEAPGLGKLAVPLWLSLRQDGWPSPPAVICSVG